MCHQHDTNMGQSACSLASTLAHTVRHSTLWSMCPCVGQLGSLVEVWDSVAHSPLRVSTPNSVKHCRPCQLLCRSFGLHRRSRDIGTVHCWRLHCWDRSTPAASGSMHRRAVHTHCPLRQAQRRGTQATPRRSRGLGGTACPQHWSSGLRYCLVLQGDTASRSCSQAHKSAHSSMPSRRTQSRGPEECQALADDKWRRMVMLSVSHKTRSHTVGRDCFDCNMLQSSHFQTQGQCCRLQGRG